MANSTPNLNEQRLKAAMQLQRQGELDKAKKQYLDLLEEDPKQVDALHLLGILYAQCGNYENAEICFSNAIALNPQLPALYTNLANVFKFKGERKKAMDCYKKALHYWPNNPVTLNNLGVLHYQNEEFNKAKNYYKKALLSNPNYADAQCNMGLLLISEAQRDKGTTYLIKAIELDPKHTTAHNQLGQLRHEQQQFNEAIEHYRQSLAVNNENPDIHHLLAAALINISEIDDAIEHFLMALKLNPTHPTAHQNLGAVYLSQYRYPEALRQFMAQINLNPTPEAYFNLATIYMNQDKHSDAIDYFKHVLKLDNQHIDTWINLGAIYIKKGDYAQATQHYEAALKLSPNNPELIYILKAINKDEAHAFTQSPKAYVENLFDNYAQHFDKHLTQVLDYKAPALLHRALMPYLDNDSLDILDIGCGTGLCGPLFRSTAKRLVGVDLSQKMLDVAATKKVYDALICSDIVETLQLPAHKNAFNLIVAADVLPYFGELKPLFQAAMQALKPEGYFAFTVEDCYETPYKLQQSARFAHAANYIATLAEMAGFAIIQRQKVMTRLQQNTPVEGHLYIMKVC